MNKAELEDEGNAKQAERCARQPALDVSNVFIVKFLSCSFTDYILGYCLNKLSFWEAETTTFFADILFWKFKI